MRNSAPAHVSYCGIEFDMSAYKTAEDFAGDVWWWVFGARDDVDSTDNAVRWANESRARALHDWNA
jgi:hypothetical protein